MNLAPIVLFVYNRPWHTRQTLEALMANHLADQSELYVFADGLKLKASSEDNDKITEVRKIVKEKHWCERVKLIESDENRGLTESIIHGINQIVNQYGKVIVLEDDLITSPWFLTYMNEGLNLYYNVSNVFSVNGYMFPIKTDRTDTILLPYTSTWGWGTWKEKWNVFEMNPQLNKIIYENVYLRMRFNLADYDYTSMLINAKNSWGIHWYFSVFLRNGIGVFPTKSLVENIGFDGSGVNCNFNERRQYLLSQKMELKKLNYIDLNFYNNYLFYFKKKDSPNYLKNNIVNWFNRFTEWLKNF